MKATYTTTVEKTKRVPEPKYRLNKEYCIKCDNIIQCLTFHHSVFDETEGKWDYYYLYRSEGRFRIPEDEIELITF